MEEDIKMNSVSLCIVLFVCLQVASVKAFDAKTETFFEIYTRANDDPLKLNLVNSRERSFSPENPVHFDPRRPTRIFVHGYFGNTATWKQYAQAYLEVGDFNFIAVNWQAGAMTLDYPLAALHRVKDVGNVLAEFIDDLVAMGLNLDDLIIVGHSLGAHICGIAGKKVQSGKLPVIIGLDPAKPLFKLRSGLDSRLHYTDATYVQVIHTSGGFLGIKHSIGDADFYPNYGCHQPGCGGISSSVCSHLRVHDLFTESLLRPEAFVANQCGNLSQIFDLKCKDTGERALMGGDMENMGKARGLYYLETSSEAPFSKFSAAN